MISVYLKEQTKQQHDDTEAKLQSQKIFDKSYTLDDYKTLLIHNYKLISRYEPQIQENLKNYPELKLDLRSKINALKTDLKNLNIETETETPTQNLENEAEAFGALYVMVWWRPDLFSYHPMVLYYLIGIPTIYVNSVPVADFFLCFDRLVAVALPIQYRKLKYGMFLWSQKIIKNGKDF